MILCFKHWLDSNSCNMGTQCEQATKCPWADGAPNAATGLHTPLAKWRVYRCICSLTGRHIHRTMQITAAALEPTVPTHAVLPAWHVLDLLVGQHTLGSQLQSLIVDAPELLDGTTSQPGKQMLSP